MPHFSPIKLSILLLVSAWLGIANTVYAKADPAQSTSWTVAAESDQKLNQFVQSVINGQPDVLVGVYISEVMAYPVVQQPSDNPGFVSSRAEVLTQFSMAARYGTTGILAHNTLAGADFSKIQDSDRVVLVYGDGSLKNYQIEVIRRYQALSPSSPYSSFIDLEDPNEVQISAGDLFNSIYTRGDQVVFQTCIANEGNPSWGRLFISATPYDPVSEFFHAKLRVSSVY